jgi:catechol 2,3-dioxygenase-like lactoylglutathione lyase family enzyme
VNVSALRSVVVGVSSLRTALRLFRDVMQLHVERDGPVDAARLAVWGLGPETTARAVELSCRGYPFGRLRLVEYAPAATTRVRDDFGPRAPDSPLAVGPKALDFYVADPIEPRLRAVVEAGYVARSAPRKYRIGQAVSEEVVVSGPDELPTLLMVGHRHAPTSLRPGSPDGPFGEIATCSVICGDLEESRRFYGDLLGFTALNDGEAPPEDRDLVCSLVDAPPGTRVHVLLYAQPGEASGKILLVHFCGASTERLRGRMTPGHLGVTLFSHDCDDVEALAGRAEAHGGRTMVAPVDVPVQGGVERTTIVCGPNEERFEFVQRLRR